MRILWLKTELLHPIDKGGKIRTYQMLKELKREHHITYLTLDDGTAAAEARELATEYCHDLICVPHRTRPKFSPGFYAGLAFNLASRLPYFMRKYKSAAMRRQIAIQLERETFDVVVCDFLMPSINMPARPGCATLLFQHNVEAMIWQRHFEIQNSRLKKAYLRVEARKTRAFERATTRKFDYVVAVSREDVETMRRDYGLEHVAEVPTGVDTAYFRPRTGEAPEPHTLVFTGSMDWLPNEDAIQYFVEQVLPRIRASVPDVSLVVVGRNPSSGLVELSRRQPSIVVTGRVDDVRRFMERAAVYIVPIRIGGGTRLKIFEAMAMERPVVSTTVGAEGLPVQDGVELLIADTPDSFADAVIRALTDHEFARGLSDRAARSVRDNFGWHRVAATFTDLCERAQRSHLSNKNVELEKEVPTIV